jgi:hypothetical protein
LQEARHPTTGAVAVAAALPDDHLVELDVGNRLGRRLGQLVQVLQHEQLEGLLGAAAGLDDPLQTFALAGQDLELALGLGFLAGKDGLGLPLGLRCSFCQVIRPDPAILWPKRDACRPPRWGSVSSAPFTGLAAQRSEARR